MPQHSRARLGVRFQALDHAIDLFHHLGLFLFQRIHVDVAIGARDGELLPRLVERNVLYGPRLIAQCSSLLGVIDVYHIDNEFAEVISSVLYDDL